MKQQILIILYSLMVGLVSGQQGISITTDGSSPDNSAMLDIKSTDKGMLIPRLTRQQKMAIISPATGLLVYQTDEGPAFNYYNGSSWMTLLTGQPANTMWLLTGNTGLDSTNQFIGTTDYRPIIGKVNGHLAFRISPGSAATSFGYDAGKNNTAINNLFLGNRAGAANTSGQQNAFVGYMAGASNVTGNYNLMIGYQAGLNNTTGNYNLFIGRAAGVSNTIGNENLFIGESAGNHNTGDGNHFIGLYAGNANTTGTYNFFEGYKAGQSNTTGSGNYFSGVQAGNKNTTAGNNTFIGYQVGQLNTTGINNAFTGYQAGHQNEIGSYNAFYGYKAGYLNSGDGNTAFGARSFQGPYLGEYNTAIGFDADVDSGDNSIAIGYDANVSYSNKAIIGNPSVTSIGGYANWSNFSDGRFKRNIREDVPGLEFIQKLRPVTYTLDVAAINDFIYPKEDTTRHHIINAEKQKEIVTGFIAQEVEQAAQSLDFTFSGVDRPQDVNTQTYALRYGDFVVPLVKAVQEQQAIIGQLMQRIEALEQQSKQ